MRPFAPPVGRTSLMTDSIFSSSKPNVATSATSVERFSLLIAWYSTPRSSSRTIIPAV
jgi:hypothetical protein